jgi:hypothetical protein
MEDHGRILRNTLLRYIDYFVCTMIPACSRTDSSIRRSLSGKIRKLMNHANGSETYTWLRLHVKLVDVERFEDMELEDGHHGPKIALAKLMGIIIPKTPITKS